MNWNIWDVFSTSHQMGQIEILGIVMANLDMCALSLCGNLESIYPCVYMDMKYEHMLKYTLLIQSYICAFGYILTLQSFNQITFTQLRR